MMDTFRKLLGWPFKPKSAPSTNKNVGSAASVSNISTTDVVKSLPSDSPCHHANNASSTAHSIGNDLPSNQEPPDMHIRLSEAWWVPENEFHSNPEPGFYGSDEYTELFNDNWFLDEMMLLT